MLFSLSESIEVTSLIYCRTTEIKVTNLQETVGDESTNGKNLRIRYWFGESHDKDDDELLER